MIFFFHGSLPIALSKHIFGGLRFHKHNQSLHSLVLNCDTGYPHDGRADKDSYPHDGHADKDSYPHDGRADKDSYPHDGHADKDSYPHDRHNQCIMLSL